jgi:hypothetical protein
VQPSDTAVINNTFSANFAKVVEGEIRHIIMQMKSIFKKIWSFPLSLIKKKEI